METKEVSLNWLGGCDISNLEAFLSENKDKGGLYFWIFKGNPERIAYIGEAKNFKSRFEGHFSNSLHGLYTAFDCAKDGDLLSCYCNVSGGVLNNFYTPKKIVFSGLDEQAEEVMRGVKVNLSFLKNLRFVFAEMKEDDPNLRKQLETIFMLKTREKYKAFKCGNWRANTNFWGVISEKLKDNTRYVINSEGLVDGALRAELGINNNFEYFIGEE